MQVGGHVVSYPQGGFALYARILPNATSIRVTWEVALPKAAINYWHQSKSLEPIVRRTHNNHNNVKISYKLSVLRTQRHTQRNTVIRLVCTIQEDSRDRNRHCLLYTSDAADE